MDLAFDRDLGLLEKVIHATADGVFTLDAAGRPRSVQEGHHCRDFGCTAELLAGPRLPRDGRCRARGAACTLGGLAAWAVQRAAADPLARALRWPSATRVMA
jgi:hypothetical protein